MPLAHVARTPANYVLQKVSLAIETLLFTIFVEQISKKPPSVNSKVVRYIETHTFVSHWPGAVSGIDLGRLLNILDSSVKRKASL